MKTFNVIQHGDYGIQAVRETVNHFLTKVARNSSTDTYTQINANLTNISNNISNLTIKTNNNPNTRHYNKYKIVPLTCPEYLPLIISFDVSTNEQNKTTLTYSSYLDMHIAGETQHLDILTITFVLDKDIPAKDIKNIEICAKHKPDPIF